ncbi:MAG: TRAP transporter permease, partial [Pseudorhodobacter sp.]|nr:TRAP transporter permease [Pseudorhodobacter sp.]
MPQTETEAELAHHDPLSSGFPAGIQGRLLFWIAVAFSAFQISTAAHLIDFPSQVTRAFHVGFLMLLGFPLLAMLKSGTRIALVLGWTMAALGVVVALY